MKIIYICHVLLETKKILVDLPFPNFPTNNPPCFVKPPKRPPRLGLPLSTPAGSRAPWSPGETQPWRFRRPRGRMGKSNPSTQLLSQSSKMFWVSKTFLQHTSYNHLNNYFFWSYYILICKYLISGTHTLHICWWLESFSLIPQNHLPQNRQNKDKLQSEQTSVFPWETCHAGRPTVYCSNIQNP